MDHEYTDDRCKLLWNDKTQNLTVCHYGGQASKRTFYGEVNKASFYELVNMLKAQPSQEESLAAILDKWEH